MSQPVDERLQALKSEVHDLEFRPAAAVRARGRSRARRQAAAVTAGCAVLATVGVAYAWPHPQQQPSAPPAGPRLHCVVALPGSPAEVRIRVLDGGAPAGVPDAAVAHLRIRGFTVLNDTPDPAPRQISMLRYGPAAIGTATVLRAGLRGDIATRFEPGRPDDTIDLIVGSAFERVATPTEMNQGLAAAGQPSPPSECTTR